MSIPRRILKIGQVGVEVVLSRTDSHLPVALISRDSAHQEDQTTNEMGVATSDVSRKIIVYLKLLIINGMILRILL